MNNKRPTLSIAPYYGGKGRMAHFIADRLDYKNTDIFVTPFGGMCRVLLNKARHEIECYNDADPGLCALMRVLADPDKSYEFIHRVYYETEFSSFEFKKQKAVYDNERYDLEEQEKREIRQLLINSKITTPHTVNSLLDATLYHEFQIKMPNGYKITPRVKSEQENLFAELKKNPIFKEKFDHSFNNWSSLYFLKKEQGSIDLTSNLDKPVSDIDLAIATYVVFTQSRDGIGKAFSPNKFKNTEQYLGRVLKLYECAERLEGVRVFQMDAMAFFRQWTFADTKAENDDITSNCELDLSDCSVFNQWINNSRVMMYCDPSYIKPDEVTRRNPPQNLGKVYARSFEYEEQECFLRCIQHAKAKIMVSNYDLDLYNKYLNETTGWRREEFFTSTAVGGSIGNTRVEVIWYNY